MSDAPIGYGLDFGTTNSLISVAWPDRVEVVDVGSRRVRENLPSVIYLHQDGNRASGDRAIEQFLVTAGVDSRLMVGIKTDLADESLSGSSAWSRFYAISELVGIVLKDLKTAADRYTGHNVERVVIGHPVAFVGTEGPEYERLQGVAMQRLLQAAEESGFREIETLEEPAAAVQEEDLLTGLVVALDFGGGTFDVAVVDYREDEAEVVALQGAAIGGERFDQLLFNAKVAPELGLRDEYEAEDGTKHRLPARVAYRSRSMLDLRGLVNDPYLPDIFRRFKDYKDGSRLERFEQLLYGGFAYHFYEEIEQAKIDLSSTDEAVIDFHRPGFDVRLTVTRGEFEALIRADLQVLKETIQLALDDAGATPMDVTRVLRTGGSSSIPAFVRMVEDLFGKNRLQTRPPFTTVVRGLGIYAQEVWG